jgi:hypothetical protein
MQYPSQQQPPTHSPQEIVIYFNRTQAIVYTIICGLALVCGIMIFASVIGFFYILGTTFQFNYIIPMILYLALMLSCLVFLG